MTTGTLVPPVAALLAALLLACSPRLDESERDEPLPAAVDALHGDAYIEAELESFRRGLAAVDTLSHASPSMDDLVLRFTDALARGDTAAFAYLAMSRQEFAWMYYPHTRYTSRPYELPADVVWMNLQNRSSRVLTRVLARYSGVELTDLRYRCPDEPEIEGPNRFWHGCVLWRDLPDGETVEERAFGSVWERGGRYKLVSFANEY